MGESGGLREGRGAVVEGAGGHPSTAQIPGAGEGCQQAGSTGGGRERPHFAQCGRMGNNLSPTPARTFLASVSAARRLQRGRRSADELHPRWICLLFSFSSVCWGGGVFSPPLSSAVFGEEEAEEKGSSGFATAGFHPW